ncbi:MAG: DUF1772 domain-containing protein [Pseudonocardiaceae bacterium]
MLELVRGATLVIATMTMGLVAGLFYAYACSVMLALRHTDDRTFINVMQRINVAILNGWFLLSFVGALLSTGLAMVLHVYQDGRPVLLPVAAALILYLVVIAITRRVNVPLNNRLGAAGQPDRIADPAMVRDHFERTWVRWNIVRAVVSTAAFGFLCWALVLYGRADTPSGI